MGMLTACRMIREGFPRAFGGIVVLASTLPAWGAGVGFDGLDDHPLLDRPAPALREVDAWIGGAPVTLADLRGKIVILEFFSLQTWDTTFAGSEDAITRFLKKWSESGVVFLGIASDDAASVAGRTRAIEGDARFASDVDLLNYAAYQVQALGQSFLIDREGVVRWTGFPDVGRSKWSAAVSQIVEKEREALLERSEASLAEAERLLGEGRSWQAVPLLATVRDRAPRVQLRSRARRLLEDLARDGKEALGVARELEQQGLLVRAAEEAERVAAAYAGTPTADEARAVTDEILDDPRFLAAVRDAAGGSEPAVRWEGNWSRALREARRRNVPIVIAFNMDGESANEQMAWLVYRDPEFVRAAKDAILVIASPDTHEEGVLETPAGTRRVCSRFGAVSCREHQRMDIEVRKKVFGGVSWVFAPQHVFLSPKGSFLFRRESSLAPQEFARLIALAKQGATDAPGGLPLPRGTSGEGRTSAADHHSRARATSHVLGGVEVWLPPGVEGLDHAGMVVVETSGGTLRLVSVETFPAGRTQLVAGVAVDGLDARAIANVVHDAFGSLHAGMQPIESPRRGESGAGGEVWSFRARPVPAGGDVEGGGGEDPLWVEVFVAGARGVHRLRVLTTAGAYPGERALVREILGSIRELGRRG